MRFATKPSKWLILFIGIVISYFPIFHYYNPLVNSIGMIGLCIISMYLCGFQPIHPYFWFSGLFTLYSIAFPILYFMGFPDFLSWTYSNETMKYQWVALVVFLITFTPQSLYKYDFYQLSKNIKNTSIKFNSTNRVMIRLIEILLFFVSIIISLKGYTSKKQIQAANDFLFSFGERLSLFLAIYFAYFLVYSIAIEKKSLRDNKTDFIWSFLPILLFTVFTGDRSNSFRYIFYVFVILFSFGKLKPRHLFLLIPLGMLVLSASNVFRYIFMNSSINKSIAADFRSLLHDFLTSDFHCAARNLQILINDSFNTKGFFGYKLIINDLLYTFFRGSGLISVSTWFNQKYFSGTIYGQAFSLVGEGYLIDGYLGVIVLFVIITLLFRYLYEKSNVNIYRFILYIVMAGGCVFAFREMFMAVLSPLFRQCLPTFLIISLCNRINFKTRSVRMGIRWN